MKTSRISRETARIANALSPSKRRTTRQSLQSFEHDSIKREEGKEVHGSESGAEEGKSSLGKRKRTAGRTTITTESTTSRRSPRKAAQVSDATSKPKKARRQPAKHIKGPNGTLSVEVPTNWEKMYNITQAMRKRVLAPVDTMGCESLAEDHRSPRDQRLQTLIALMLSSQTKDTVTFAAMKNMQDNMPGGLCLESLLEIQPDALNELIAKVGFHNTKTKHIKATAVILQDKFKGDIPNTIEGLISLPGVGPKMAYLCMSAAWGRDEGIGVDVHVHRITNLWGWHKTSTPEQTRAELESWLPRDKWHEINWLLVGFGQTICLPVGRKCDECDLSKEGSCPSAVAGKKSSPVKKRVEKEVEMNVDGEEVKVEELRFVSDDVVVKVEADLENDGTIEIQSIAGAEE